MPTFPELVAGCEVAIAIARLWRLLGVINEPKVCHISSGKRYVLW